MISGNKRDDAMTEEVKTYLIIFFIGVSLLVFRLFSKKEVSISRQQR